MPDGVKVKVNDSVLKRRLLAFERKLARPLKDEILELAIRFTQTTIKNTPISKNKTRPIFKLTTPFFSGESKEVMKWAVPIRGGRKNRARGNVKYGRIKDDINKFRKITYRGAGKYGWFTAGKMAIGEKFNAKLPAIPPETRRLGIQLGAGRKFFGNRKPYIWLLNTVKRIREYGMGAVRKGISSAKRSIQFKSKKRVKRNYSKLWKMVK